MDQTTTAPDKQLIEIAFGDPYNADRRIIQISDIVRVRPKEVDNFHTPAVLSFRSMLITGSGDEPEPPGSDSGTVYNHRESTIPGIKVVHLLESYDHFRQRIRSALVALP